MRAVLSMSPVVATRDAPVLKACYARRLAAGTRKKVAFIAWMHTLLTLMHAMVSEMPPWQPREVSAKPEKCKA